MSEQFYDEVIAPALLELGRQAAERGMTFIASVEWEPGETGSTACGDFSNSGVTQTLTLMSARCNRNIDAVLLGLIRKFDVSQSIFLSSHNKINSNRGQP